MEQQTKRAAVDLPLSEHRKLRQAALDDGVTATQIMREGIALAIAPQKAKYKEGRRS